MIADGALPPTENGEPETGIKAPPGLTENTEMSLDALQTKTKLPAVVVVIPSGPLTLPLPPLEKGEPETAVRAPVLKLRVNAEMVASDVLGTYTTPVATTTPAGSTPTWVGGAVSVRAPEVAFTLKTSTPPAVPKTLVPVTRRKAPVGSNAPRLASPSSATGNPESAVTAPVLLSRLNA